MKPEQIEWQNAEAKRYLDERGGSKAGAYAFLFDNHQKLRPHLPTRTRYIAPGEDPGKALSEIDSDTPKIVRGCDPRDVTGMVDVIHTKKDLFGASAVRSAIKEVLQSARADDVHDFVEYESGKPFDGNIGILVQDDMNCDSGMIIEHPHERGVYRINMNISVCIGGKKLIEEICTEDGRALKQVVLSDDPEAKYVSRENMVIPPGQIKEIISLYRKIFETGLMPASHSYQMEFGIIGNHVFFYQSRVFRPFQPAAEFDLHEIRSRLEGKSGLSILYNAYGVTPAEGWELPLAELDKEFIAKYAGEDQMAYAFNNYERTESSPLSARPENLQAYLPYQKDRILGHGHFRWMQKAPVSLVGVRRLLHKERVISYEDKLQTIDEEMRVRVYSNGIEGLAVVVE